MPASFSTSQPLSLDTSRGLLSLLIPLISLILLAYMMTRGFWASPSCVYIAHHQGRPMLSNRANG